MRETLANGVAPKGFDMDNDVGEFRHRGMLRVREPW
jgi:hypothetical protein